MGSSLGHNGSVLEIRAETQKDRKAVSKVLEHAFDGPDEAGLVERLRPLDERFISMVAEQEAKVVAHILFSPVTVGTNKAIALGPVAVLPNYQRQGIGSQLIHAGLDSCRTKGERAVFVLGHPTYYPRFGFELAAPKGLFFMPPDTDAAFFVLDLVPGASQAMAGKVNYPAAFMT